MHIPAICVAVPPLLLLLLLLLPAQQCHRRLCLCGK
jgi:hypothetical protein